MSNRNTYQIVQGAPRHVYGARKRITQATHALVVQATEGATAKQEPTAWWATDLRRGRRSIYGGLLRFIDHLHAKGIPMETALMIPDWIASYIRDVWTGTPPTTGAVANPMTVTGEYEKAA